MPLYHQFSTPTEVGDRLEFARPRGHPERHDLLQQLRRSGRAA